MLKELRLALIAFSDIERDLLIQDAHEESISTKLVTYLGRSFPDFPYSIDSQYNKRILDNQLVKKQAEFLLESLPRFKWPKNFIDGHGAVSREILPDIIFHDRNSFHHNFIMMEIKKSTNRNVNDREWDLLKLREMTRRELKYEFGVFVNFFTGKDYRENRTFSIIVFENGEITYSDQ
ncbi:hypothetical protein SAMN04488109_4765 [Chryseolinea serpens]|uniref:Uncharacterized protein n=1 Tax=Chryseolinea serpens TaxID=947013 RepID=A0A1M5ULS1_9BACT|nr:hypothetical protein [Chryseolinea serpens]SHH63880.1 hypothetical protein SAMN04488109_4765 [Chryseolinea serpens]